MKEPFDLYLIEAGTPVNIPYLDDGIPAGFPSPAQDYVRDSIDLNDVLITTPGSTYFARVNSYFLAEEELEEGDAIIFDTTLKPTNGDLALCIIDGERILKYIQIENGIFLIEGGSKESVEMNASNDASIIGIVTSIIKPRRYKSRRTLIYNPRKEPDKQQLTRPKRAIRWGYTLQDKKDINGVIDLNTILIRNPIATYFGRVKGFSLMEDGIDNDDSVIIDTSLNPENNDLVVSYTDNGFTMKYIHIDDDGILLMPGNKNYPPIRITEENELLIWGIVTTSIKHLRRKR